MSDLSNIEKRKLERDLGMSSGYILNFSNRTFAEFMEEVANVDIYSERYDYGSGSKANRMRAFWDQESNYAVAQVLEALLNDWDEYAGNSDKPPSDNFSKIILRLKESAPVPEINVIQPNAEEKGFEELAKAVRASIESNKPEEGLDRLHTFLVKYFRHLCNKYEIEVNNNKPLHSLVGEYVKAIKNKGLIESEITERILKSTISIMEAFNNVRNNQSFAHDNIILNYNESLLIFGHVTSSIRFIEALEMQNKPSRRDELDDIPF